MSADSARSSRFSSWAALRNCSSSRLAAFSSNSAESRTCAIDFAWSLSVLAPSSFQNRLLTRPEVRVLVFATRLRYPRLHVAERGSAPTADKGARTLVQRQTRRSRPEPVGDGFEADPLVDGVRYRVGEIGEQDDVRGAAAAVPGPPPQR